MMCMIGCMNLVGSGKISSTLHLGVPAFIALRHRLHSDAPSFSLFAGGCVRMRGGEEIGDTGEVLTAVRHSVPIEQPSG